MVRVGQEAVSGRGITIKMWVGWAGILVWKCKDCIGKERLRLVIERGKGSVPGGVLN